MRENPRTGVGGVAGVVSEGPRNVVELRHDESEIIEVVTYIVPFPVPQVDAVQGWALSIAHSSALLDLVGVPTIEGTDAGDVFSGGFEKTEGAQSSGGVAGVGGGEGDEAGVVSAVVLSFTQPSVLDPSVAQSILRTRYSLSGEIGIAGAGPALVRFRDGLRGSGQPVANAITVAGATQEPIHRVPLEIRRVGLYGSFVRGDANSDARVDLADAVWILNDLLRGGPPTLCPSAGDANADGRLDVTDPIYLAQHRFLGGPRPPAPFPECGEGDESFDLACPEGTQPTCGS